MPKEILVAIHQPSFFSWLGFFDKIIRSDIFIILDSVQFPKKGGYWANRVKIMMNGTEQWLTIPIVRSYSGTRLINEMEIDNSVPWQEKMIKTIDLNYKKASYYNGTFPLIKDLLNIKTDNLFDYNLTIINQLCNILDIKTDKIIKSSTLPGEGAATDLLISLVKHVGGTSYMCGGGAAGYQEDEKFEQAGLKLIYQNYKHPVYTQFNSKEFVPGLSVIDSLMNTGITGVKRLLETKKD